MTTTYPIAIDNGISLPLSIDLVTPVKAQTVNVLRDAIVAIENELGVSPSAEFTTVAERLDYLTTLALQCGTGSGGTLTPPINPGDNYKIAFANSGDLDYASSVSVLTSQNGLSLGGLLLISQSSLITTPSTPNALLYQNSGNLRFYYNSVDKNVLFAPASANNNDVLTYSSGSWIAAPQTGGGLSNAYVNITDGTTTAAAIGLDTIRFRSANNILTTTVGSNDPTYGDNLLLTVNQANIDHGSIGGLSDDDHLQYVHNTTARTITARHVFNPPTSNSPFVLGANAQSQLVTGLNADQLDGQEGSYYQNATNLNSGTLPAARFNDTSHGSRGGGTLHPTVTNSLAGFIPAVGVLNTIPQSTGSGISYVSELTNPQKVTVAKAGSVIGSRSVINFIDGYNTTIAAVDNSGSGRVDITINSTGGGTGNAYANITDGTTTAVASGADTIRFRSANNILTTAVASNDPTYGDNLLLTINQSNIDHGSIGGLSDDDHTQYVHNTTARTITAQHTFNYSGSPFLLGVNSQNQLVTGLNSDKLDGYDGYYYLSTVRLNSGSNIGTRNRLNFIAGANTTLSAVDDSINDEIAITINSSGGSSGLSNAYANITDGTTTASAVASDTITFRSANNILTTAVGSDDSTYGDNLLLTINQSNIDHGSIGGLSDDDHTQYVHNTTARTITAQHTFNYAGSPFLLGISSQNQLITGLNSDKLDGYDGYYYLSTVRLNSGANIGTRSRLNFIAGTNTTLSAVDDIVNDEVAITINSAGGGGGGLSNAYVNITDGTTTASAVGGDTIRFRSANNILTTTVGSDDPTYGDNLLLTINQSNIDHGSIGGLSDDDHTQYVHNVNSRTIVAQHTFNYSGSPFLLGTGSQNQLVQYLNSDLLDGYDGSYYLSTVRINSGSNVGTRNRLNFIPGTNVTITAVDDPVDNEIDITINSSGGGGGGALFITGFSGVASTDLNAQTRIGSFYANATGYTTATLYAILETTNAGATCEIELYDVTAAAFITSSILTTTSLTSSLVSASLSIPADIKNSDRVYEIYLRRSSGSTYSVRCTNVSLRLS